MAGARSLQAQDHYLVQTITVLMQTPSWGTQACRLPPLRVDGWSHACRTSIYTQSTPKGPSSETGEVGIGQGCVEGGCQLVLVGGTGLLLSYLVLVEEKSFLAVAIFY